MRRALVWGLCRRVRGAFSLLLLLLLHVSVATAVGSASTAVHRSAGNLPTQRSLLGDDDDGTQHWMIRNPQKICADCAPVYRAPAEGVRAQSASNGHAEDASWVVILHKREDCRPDELCSEGEAVGSGRFNSLCYQRYHTTLNGMALRMDETNLAIFLQAAKGCVQEVWEDGTLSVSMSQRSPPWGLDRIDQRSLPLSDSYTYTSDGTGVHAYVFDTGILESHEEFKYLDGRPGSRVKQSYTGFQDGDTTDCHGHGTHVAATLGGLTYGVAKNVTLHAVRVLDCQGNAQYSRVIKAFDDIAESHLSPAVAVLSLGGEPYTALDVAAQGLVDAGISVSVAAGNDNRDACMQSPARVEAVITVAATSASDAIYPESNYGQCVDLFAPGVNILSASHSSNSGTRYMTGTSMAVPFVAGAAALYLQRNPAASPFVVAQTLVNSGVRGQVASSRGAPNVLLSTNLLRPLVFSPSEFRLTDETAGSTLRVYVTLSLRPSSPVEVRLVSWPSERVSVSVLQLRFEPNTWNDRQSLVLTFWDSSVAQESRGVGFNIGFSLSSSDPEFDGLDAYLYVADTREKLGESLQFPLQVSSLPFADSRSTASYANLYNEGCSEYRDSGDAPDIVYAYRPDADEVLDINLCNSEFDTKLYVFRDSTEEVYACNDDYEGCGYESRMRIRVSAGSTYYVVVDGFDGDFGTAKLRIERVEGMDISLVPPGQLELPGMGAVETPSELGYQPDEAGPNLVSLRITGCTLSPAFSPFRVTYTCSAPRGSLDARLVYTTSSSDASVVVTVDRYYPIDTDSAAGHPGRKLLEDGDEVLLPRKPTQRGPMGSVSSQAEGSERLTFVEGANLVSIEVSVSDGRSRKYTVVATAPSPTRSSYLQNLSFGAGGRSGPQLELSPSFRPDRFDYSALLADGWESLWIEAAPLSDSPLVTIKIDEELPRYLMPGGTQATAYQLGAGTLDIPVTVTAADGITKSTYRLALQRGGGEAQDMTNCSVTSWGAWTACSRSCGGGLRRRERSVLSPPSENGAACPELVEEEVCNTQACSAFVMNGNTTFIISVAATVLVICLAVFLGVCWFLCHRRKLSKRRREQSPAPLNAASQPSAQRRHLPFIPPLIQSTPTDSDSVLDEAGPGSMHQAPQCIVLYEAGAESSPSKLAPRSTTAQLESSASKGDVKKKCGSSRQHRFTH